MIKKIHILRIKYYKTLFHYDNFAYNAKFLVNEYCGEYPFVCSGNSGYKQRILTANIIDEKFRIVRKIVIMKGVYSI